MKSKADKDLEFLRGMEKLKGAPVKDTGYTSPLGDEIMKVKNLGVDTPESLDNFKRNIAGATQHISTKEAMPLLSGDAFTDKISKLKAAKKLGSKLLGFAPLAGAGMAALSGDPAMAAEELAQDAMGPAGLAYEAIRPTESGNPEEEQQMLAERQALEDYKNSPARFSKIKQSLGK